MKGKLTISTEGGKLLRLILEDAASEIEFLDIKITSEDFIMALTTRPDRDCVFELRGLEYVGKRREWKKETVTVPGKYGDPITHEMKIEAIRPFCVDGWLCQSLDLIGNHHYSKGDRAYEVVFVRFVESEATDPTG